MKAKDFETIYTDEVNNLRRYIMDNCDSPALPLSDLGMHKSDNSSSESRGNRMIKVVNDEVRETSDNTIPLSSILVDNNNSLASTNSSQQFHIVNPSESSLTKRKKGVTPL